MDEGLRLSYGSMHRLSRSHPDQTLRFHGWTIPPGTPVGTSVYLIHTNPAIFPDPHAFRLERWLGLEASERRRLKGYLCNFGRGTRQCVGMTLAYMRKFISRLDILCDAWDVSLSCLRRSMSATLRL